MKTTVTVITAACLLCLSFMQCGAPSPTAGGGTETSNGIAVYVADRNLRLSAGQGVTAMIYGLHYNPVIDSGFADTLYGDADAVTALDSGWFNLFAWSPDAKTAAYIDSIPAGENAEYRATMKKPGAIAGVIDFAADANHDSVFVFLNGSPFQSRVNNDAYAIAAIPAGKYETGLAVYFNGLASIHLKAVKNPSEGGEKGVIHVASDDTLFLDTAIVK